MWWLVVVVAVMVVIYRKMADSRRYWKLIDKIPGPKGLPVIGNLLTTYTTPENMFKLRRQWGKEFFPIYKIKSGRFVYVALMNPEDMETVLASKAHEQKGIVYAPMMNWLGKGLLLSEGKQWKSRRRILTSAFHFNILQDFIHIFNKETKNLVRYLEEHCDEPYIDVAVPVTEFTLSTIIETSMGIKLSEQNAGESYKKAFIDICAVIIRRLWRPWMLIKPIYQFTNTCKEEKLCIDVLHKFSYNVIAERKKTFENNNVTTTADSSKKRQAMLDLLLSAQKSGANIDDEGIRQEVDTFLFGGHDTTSVAISFNLLALANEPEIQEEVFNEITGVLGDFQDFPTYSELQQLPLLERCIKETLRLYPSAPLINRVLGEDIKSSTGYIIPKGTDVFLVIYELHRDPAVWENPLKYDPDRFLPENISKRHPYSFLPFSAGPRNCIGQKYALFQIKAALCGILRKFKLEPVDTPETLIYKMDLVLRANKEIRVKFVPRHRIVNT